MDNTTFCGVFSPLLVMADSMLLSNVFGRQKMGCKMWFHVNNRASYVDPGRDNLNNTDTALSQTAQPTAMIKEALLCGLSAIVDLSGIHYRSAVPKLGTVQDQTALYWKNVGGYIATGIRIETPRIREAKQKQLELDLPTV